MGQVYDAALQIAARSASEMGASERRKTLATAEGRGKRVAELYEPRSGERFFRRYAADCGDRIESTALLAASR